MFINGRRHNKQGCTGLWSQKKNCSPISQAIISSSLHACTRHSWNSAGFASAIQTLWHITEQLPNMDLAATVKLLWVTARSIIALCNRLNMPNAFLGLRHCLTLFNMKKSHVMTLNFWSYFKDLRTKRLT